MRVKARTETSPPYAVRPANQGDEDAIIADAIAILSGRLHKPGEAMNSPQTAKDYFTLNIADRAHEVFCVMFLDAQNRLIECSEMFRGSLTQTSVYPREVVKAALQHNAAAVILAHNHPSGLPDPSRADEALTRVLQSALALVEVKVLDHIICGGKKATSFGERGLL